MHLVRSLAVLVLIALPVHAAETSERKSAEPPKLEEESGLGALYNAAPEHVRARLGDPDVSRQEGKGAFWTYQMEHCVLFLFFHEGPKGLRLSGASTGPRQRGEFPMSVRACLASAIQREE